MSGNWLAKNTINMKKYLLFALTLMITINGFAQMSERTSVSSGIWLEVGAGGNIFHQREFFGTDDNHSGVGINIGARYTKMFNNYIGWDVIKINAQTDLKNFKALLGLQAMTGLRLVSPVIFGHQTAYLSGAIGGSYYPDPDKGNFAWEGGLGINISPKTSIGAFYNDQVIDDEHIRFVGIRFSVKI